MLLLASLHTMSMMRAVHVDLRLGVQPTGRGRGRGGRRPRPLLLVVVAAGDAIAADTHMGSECS